MTDNRLSASGVGDVPQWLADEGLELAIRYFEDNDLDPIACYAARSTDPSGILASHWDKADQLANTVLLGDPRYENSMITLELE